MACRPGRRRWSARRPPTGSRTRAWSPPRPGRPTRSSQWRPARRPSAPDARWVPARPGEADSEFQVAAVAQAVRAVRRLVPDPAPPVEIGTTLSPAWLATDDRARSHHADAVAVLEGPQDVAFVGVPGEDGALRAKGRVACDGDWAGITDVWVSPALRRQGQGLVVLAALLGWAAERGATTAYLQVRGDNAPGLGLYETLGFRTHHTYRYLAEPGPDR